MTYSFEPFLEALGENWYDDDPLLRRLLARYGALDGDGGQELRAWGAVAAGPLRELAERSALPENRPRLRRWDPYRRRVDRIVLPDSTRAALRETHGRHGMGALHGDPYVFYARAYLYAQNGEAGVVCSLACTDGLVRVLEALGDRDVHREAVERVRGSDGERIRHGAQFVTEIQGGSDVPANRTRARPDGDAFRLHGRKWFCSNVNADYFLVTARPEGAAGEGREDTPVGLFLVPARLEGGGPERNGHTIDRLKEKLGTRELATAELTFDGARGWPVGPLERGLPNLARHVLVTSRFHCAYWAASSLRRAERIAGAYARFRHAFGRPIADYPLVADALDRIGGARRRALAATFGLLELWEEARAGGSDAGRDFRVLLSLAKPVLTRRATRLIRDAMMLLGGNGIEERFSPLPRLWRDAAIMETWEGPHDVLFTQALRDFGRLDLEPDGFLERVAGADRRRLADDLAGLVARSGEEDVTVPFAALAPRIVDAFADRVLGEAGTG